LKLSLKINLEPARGRAVDMVNAWAEAQARKVDPAPAVHAAKLVAAERRPELLGAEAKQRGISDYALYTLIRSKADETVEKLVDIDARRRAAMAVISTAPTEAEIWAAVNALSR
jgi:hypothetical protein